MGDAVVWITLPQNPAPQASGVVVQTDQVSELLIEVSERVILPRFGSLTRSEIQEKSPGDLVTVADREAEIELSQVFAQAHPNALILGEEAAFTNPGSIDALGQAEHAWVIDPVDGTRNFARGRPDFAVMVAEVRDGQVVRGWIWQPIHQTMYLAERGAGVTRNGEQLAPAARTRQVPLGATYIPIPGEEQAEVKVTRSWGSCGVDYPKLVEGEVDFLSYRTMFPWDHLPGSLMVRELGGRIATAAGVDYAPGVVGRRLVAAGTPELWQRSRDALFGN